MKTLAIANQKGGVGKTTIVVNLAQFASYSYGKKVAVIDLDTQGNASWTLADNAVSLKLGDVFFSDEEQSFSVNENISLISSDYKLANIEKLNVEDICEKLKKIKNQLEQQGVELFIIDTPPSMGNALVSTLLVADFVLCPIELEAFSLQGVKKMRTVINNVKQKNSNITELGLLPSRVDNRNANHRKQLAEMKQLYTKLVCPFSISLRSSVADAISSRTWLGKNKKRSAKSAIVEFSSLTDWVLHQTELA